MKQLGFTALATVASLAFAFSALAQWLLLGTTVVLIFCYGLLDNIGYSNLQKKYEKTCIMIASVYMIAAAVFFILLFPYASGMNVSDAWLDIGRHFARIWY